MDKAEKIIVINDFYKSLVIRDCETDYSNRGSSSSLSSYSFFPKWEEWKYKPSANTLALSELSLGLEPGSNHAINNMIERIKNCSDYYMQDLNYSVDEILNIAKICKRLVDEIGIRERIILNNIREHVLKTSRVESTRSIYFQGSTSYVLFSDFVDWLNKIGLHYSSELDDCYREENYINTDKELSDTRKVLAMVVELAKEKGLNQDALSSSIDESQKYKDKGISKRKINGIFSSCNKELNNS